MSTSDIFVGSSSEFLALPWRPPPQRLINDVLNGQELSDGNTINVHTWDGWFEDHPGAETFRILDLAAKTHEWAILIFRGDDLHHRIREVLETRTVRDNVLFELGLFYGYLGSMRVFILEDSGDSSETRMQVASDIYGIQRTRFSSAATFRRALQHTLKIMRERSTQWYARWAPASSLAIGYLTSAVEPFLRKANEIRREADGVDRNFSVEILLPTNDFRGTQFLDVKDTFRNAGYAQIGADGFTKERPLLWAEEVSIAPETPYFPLKYFDVPTTLITAETVIDKYLGDASPNERRDLFQNQANVFASYVKQTIAPNHQAQVEVKRFDSMAEVGQYLAERRAQGP